MDLYMKEREGKPNAECQSRSPMPSTSAEPSSSPWGQARPTWASEADRGKRGRWGQARLVGAGETGGGRRGWWGQARPMGAVSRRAKSIVNTRLEHGNSQGNFAHDAKGSTVTQQSYSAASNMGRRISM